MVVLLFLTVAQTQPFFAPQKTPFVAPDQLFSVDVPVGWTVRFKDGDANSVEFVGSRGGDAVLQIQRKPVPAGANPKQVLLRDLEVLKKLPRFRKTTDSSPHIAGFAAVGLVATYAYQGNVQYLRAFERIVLVAGSEAFTLHFDCADGAAPEYGTDLSVFYQSFRPRPQSAADHPFAVPLPSEILGIPEVF